MQSTKILIYRSGLFRITKAAITPGTQPQTHSKNVIRIEPQPLSKTAKGGKIIDNITRQILMILFFDLMYLCDVILLKLLQF